MTTRCPWAEKSPQLLIYHDLEWGVPVHDERQLFENLSLEIFDFEIPRGVENGL